MAAVIGVVTFQLLTSYSRDREASRARAQVESLALYLSREIRQARNTQTQVLPLGRRVGQGITGGDLYYHGTPIFGQRQPFLPKLDGDLDQELGISERVIRKGEVVEETVRRPGDGFDSLAIAVPMEIPFPGGRARREGALVLLRPREDLAEQVVPLTQRVLIGVGVGAFLALVFGLYLGRRMTQPLRRLMAATERVAAGDFRLDDQGDRREGGSGEVGRLTQAFRAMAAELEEAEIRQREFLLAVSHELRTPLTALSGHAEAVRDGISPDPDASLQVVALEAERLQRLVEDLLDLARIDARRFRLIVGPVDATALLHEVGELFSQRARDRGITFDVRIDSLPADLRTDPDRVAQVVTNLLENAFTWTPAGGRVGLTARPAAGTAIEVRVSDSGPGIPEPDRARIFSRFFTTRGVAERRASGTGLGLAIALELTVQMGGTLRLEAPAGGGSCFVLTLPAGVPAGAPVAAEEVPAAS